MEQFKSLRAEMHARSMATRILEMWAAQDKKIKQ